ncbi:Far upstream element-binding protein 2 [Morus notabilis]|uniref:Far upstream element-binding protein 2 n=1 Tax=Morus notabilis TaxID=981085 RepID=W9RBH1_9ROSA|nr:far upstream element-binding protein 1 [Morus notabilis]EXB63559.1 Far upstream element-binding protein 2 [Morus notabilis]
MKEDQEEHHHQEEEEQARSETTTDTTTKRKLEDNILFAKQKAQEIAARLVSNAESKRPRLADDDSPEPAFHSNSASNPLTVSFVAQTGQTSKRISIPNGKVGLIIGKGGETIKYLQNQSGAKIQITKDLEADPYSLTREVELTGTSEQISRAEQLINDVIAQTEAGGSAPSAKQDAPSAKQDANPVQPGAEQFVMKVPNNKVALLIGKGGETIRNMQSRSGARMQIVPLHLPPGDTSTERTVYIDGLKEQIESAKELINEVLSGKRLVNPSGANSYMQPAYAGAANWGAPGQPPMQQQPQYGYTQPGSYGQPPPPASYYSNHPTSVAAWDPSHQATHSQQPQQSTGYDYYGQQTQVGLAPSNPSYSYNQTLPASHSYGQSYSQQPSNYGQPISSQVPVPNQPNPYVSSEYGAPPPSSNLDGTSSSQAMQPASAYPYAHSQTIDNSHAGYWAYSSSTSQPPAQPFYDQTGYYQTMYGSQQAQVPSAVPHSGYGEDGYPSQSASAPTDYDQATNPAQGGQQLEQQPQEQLATNGIAHSSVNGAQRAAGGNSDEMA